MCERPCFVLCSECNTKGNRTKTGKSLASAYPSQILSFSVEQDLNRISKCLSFQADRANTFKHMSFRSCYDATDMLTDWETSRLNVRMLIFFLLNRVRVDVTHLLDPRVASWSYGLQPPFGSPHVLYLEGLLTARPTGVKWTSKRETLHWHHNHS